MAITKGDTVTLEYTGRTADGTVFDTSRESVADEAGLADAQSDREFTPITVEVGAEQLIEGLEDALLGLEEGEAPTVEIPPAEAYGEWSEDEVREFETAEFEDMVGEQTPEEGAYLETREGGLAQIMHVDEDVVKVDFNHDLAGETLAFDVEIVSVD